MVSGRLRPSVATLEGRSRREQVVQPHPLSSLRFLVLCLGHIQWKAIVKGAQWLSLHRSVSQGTEKGGEYIWRDKDTLLPLLEALSSKYSYSKCVEVFHVMY